MTEPCAVAGVVFFRFDGPPGEMPAPGWRHELLPVLKSFGDESAAEDVVLAAGEMLANAMEHGGGVWALHVEGRRGDVRVEVYDHAASFEPISEVPNDRGRGLSIVDTLADDWGWVPAAGGKMVWARFGCGAAVQHAS
jgi:hypothetical protein